VGMSVDIAPLGLDNAAVALFSESQSRIVVTVAKSQAKAFESLFAGQACHRLGEVTADRRFVVRTGKQVRVDASIDDLKAAWQRPLAW